MTHFARTARRLLLATSIVAVLAAACNGANSAGDSAASTTGGAATGITAGITGSTSAPAEGSGGGGTSVVDVPAAAPSVIKTARLSLEVGKDGFTDAADRATEIAGEEGGFVESSSSQGSDVRSGRLTLRIPVDRFEHALSAVSKLGDIRLRSVSGKDVTSQFVDLEARLRNARAQETVLLGILHQATTVSATLDVQRTLSDVQLQIEQLTGQERSLQNRADMGTIVLELFETGKPPPRVVEAGITNPKLTEAWTRAKATFFGLLYGIIVSASVVVPLALLSLIALLVWRRVRARTDARPSTPEPAAEA
jgi:hypothetical protein